MLHLCICAAGTGIAIVPATIESSASFYHFFSTTGSSVDSDDGNPHAPSPLWLRTAQVALVGTYEFVKTTHRRIVRAAFYEDLLVACLLAVLAGIRPSDASACNKLAILMLLVTLAHLAYLCIVRPHLSVVEWGLSSCVAAALVALAAVAVAATAGGGDAQQGVWESRAQLVGTAVNVVIMLQMLISAALEIAAIMTKMRGARRAAMTPGGDTGVSAASNPLVSRRSSTGGDVEMDPLQRPLLLLESATPSETQQEEAIRSPASGRSTPTGVTNTTPNGVLTPTTSSGDLTRGRPTNPLSAPSL